MMPSGCVAQQRFGSPSGTCQPEGHGGQDDAAKPAFPEEDPLPPQPVAPEVVMQHSIWPAGTLGGTYQPGGHGLPQRGPMPLLPEVMLPELPAPKLPPPELEPLALPAPMAPPELPPAKIAPLELPELDPMALPGPPPTRVRTHGPEPSSGQQERGSG